MLPIPAPAIPNTLLHLPRSVLADLLNRLFHEALQDGELDFLDERRLCVVVSGSGIRFILTLHAGRMRVGPADDRWDLRISGSLYDFMQLASRREDADTLFFQRRLKTEGDTELGLYLKNFLDAQDLSTLPHGGLIEGLLSRSLSVHDRLAALRHRLLPA